MRLWNTARHGLSYSAIALGGWFATAAAAWARQSTPPPTTSSSQGPTAWVLPYFIVILCIGLGMLVLCRTSRRSDRAKPQKFESLKTKD
jgi:hypothetical protein